VVFKLQTLEAVKVELEKKLGGNLQGVVAQGNNAQGVPQPNTASSQI
jgi:hypothetical protein